MSTRRKGENTVEIPRVGTHVEPTNVIGDFS